MLGSSQTMYVSRNNIFLASAHYPYYPILYNARTGSSSTSEQETTILHKISINTGNISYIAQGEVPGHILNQFSMDEHNGFFRIATTSGTTGAKAPRPATTSTSLMKPSNRYPNSRTSHQGNPSTQHDSSGTAHTSSPSSKSTRSSPLISQTRTTHGSLVNSKYPDTPSTSIPMMKPISSVSEKKSTQASTQKRYIPLEQSTTPLSLV